MILPDIHEIKTFEEAMNGIILIGWTTAMFFSVVHNITQKYHNYKNPVTQGLTPGN